MLYGARVTYTALALGFTRRRYSFNACTGCLLPAQLSLSVQKQITSALNLCLIAQS